MDKQCARYGWVSALCMAVLLLPFIYAAFFVFPQGDDFSPAVRSTHLFDIFGGIQHMFSAWWKWSGRYFYHFLWVFIGDVAEHRGLYTLTILLCFFIFWLSVFGIARELGRDKGRGHAAFFATLWLAAMLCTHGDLPGWYLLIEVQTLTGGHYLTLLYIWSLCRLWNRPVVSRGAKWFCILSAVAAIGVYEHSALMVLLVTLAAYGMARLYNHPHQKTFLLLVKVATVCFLISYLARGNFRRQTKRNVTFELMLSQLLNAGNDWLAVIPSSFCNPVFLVGLITAGIFSPGWTTPLYRKIPVRLILPGGILALLGYTVSLTLLHALSDVTLGEALKIPAQMAQYCTIIVMFCLLSCREPLRLDVLCRAGRPLVLGLFLVILLNGSSNIYPVLWNGLSGAYVRSEAAYKKREAVFARHSGEVVQVEPLNPPPYPIYSDTLGDAVKDWPNKYAAPFYKLAGIEALPAAPDAAYAAAERNGVLNWRPLGKGGRSALSSVSLPPNATYDFDWIFIECDGEETPSVRVLPLSESLAAGFPAWLQARIGQVSWPFARLGEVREPERVILEQGAEKGKSLFAVRLPQGAPAGPGGLREVYVVIDGKTLHLTETARP